MKVKKMVVCAGVGLVAMVATPVCGAETNAVEAAKGVRGDPSVERLLREQDLNYRVDGDGDFHLSFSMLNGRTQVIMVSSKLSELDGMKLRKVFSYAYRGRITKPMAMELLREDYKIGYWYVESDEKNNRDIVIFMAQVPWDVTATDLETILRRMAETADRKEDEWSDVDEL